MTAPAAVPPAASLRGTVGVALLVSTVAHAGALYWAVAVTPPREVALSAGAPVAVEVVLIQGPGERVARGAGAPGSAPERPVDDAAPVPDRATNPDVKRDARDAAPTRDRTDHPLQDPSGGPAVTAFAPVEPAPVAALHHTREAAPDDPADGAPAPVIAPAPPPPPKPVPAAAPGNVPLPVAHAVAAASHAPTTDSGAASAEGGAAGGTTADGSEDGQAAAPHADNRAPRYPYAARMRGQQGRVLLRVVVTPGGDAGAVAVERSSGYESLDRAAQQTVQRWRFRPALRNGEPVAANVRVPIRFALE